MTRTMAFALLVGLPVVACGPSVNASQVASRSADASPTATATGTPSATATPTTAPTPEPTASPTPVASEAVCLSGPYTGILPSDRLTTMQILGRPGSDVVRFELGEPSLQPVGQATVTVGPAHPPFSQASSGQPIALKGEHVLQVVFKGMSIQNDAGEETFTGGRELKATDPSRSVRDVVMFDESEGQVGLYVGYDGPACVSVATSGNGLELAILFGPGS